MDRKLEVRTDPEWIIDLTLELSQCDDLEVQLKEEPASITLATLEVDDQKKHPMYSLSIAELASVIISVSSLITSLVTLATKLMEHRSKMRETKDEKPAKEPIIIVNNKIVALSQFSTAQELSIYLEEQLK